MYNTISIVCVIYSEVTLYNKQTWSLLMRTERRFRDKILSHGSVFKRASRNIQFENEQKRSLINV